MIDKMLMVVTSRHDQAAQSLVSRWAAHSVVQLNPQDLTRPGWRYTPGDCGGSIAIVGGQPVMAHEIDGVLVRLPWVVEEELADIALTDRAYVASEMSAFLLAWLSALPCPVINRPTPTCLAGPAWSRQRWVQLAAHEGVPVRSLIRSSAIDDRQSADTPALVVNVVGGVCVDRTDNTVARFACQLAASANVDLLSVRFGIDGAHVRFVDADPWVDVESAGVADAILGYLRRLSEPTATSA